MDPFTPQPALPAKAQDLTRASSQDKLSGEEAQYNEKLPYGREDYDDDLARAPMRPKSNTLAVAPQFQFNNQNPNSQSMDERQQFAKPSGDPLSGAGGRALLHDLDTKFNEQDRMMKYLLTQIQTLEDQQALAKENTYKIRDADSHHISKLEN